LTSSPTLRAVEAAGAASGLGAIFEMWWRAAGYVNLDAGQRRTWRWALGGHVIASTYTPSLRFCIIFQTPYIFTKNTSVKQPTYECRVKHLSNLVHLYKKYRSKTTNIRALCQAFVKPRTSLQEIAQYNNQHTSVVSSICQTSYIFTRNSAVQQPTYERCVKHFTDFLPIYSKKCTRKSGRNRLRYLVFFGSTTQ